MDSQKALIMEWSRSNGNNLRSLLCSLHTVLWENARWQCCEMSTLESLDEVTKAFRRARLAVHPDKHIGSVNERTAPLIFMELNNAWTAFENDATQQKEPSTKLDATQLNNPWAELDKEIYNNAQQRKSWTKFE